MIMMRSTKAQMNRPPSVTNCKRPVPIFSVSCASPSGQRSVLPHYSTHGLSLTYGRRPALAGDLAPFIRAQERKPALLFFFSHWFLSNVDTFLASTYSGLTFFLPHILDDVSFPTASVVADPLHQSLQPRIPLLPYPSSSQPPISPHLRHLSFHPIYPKGEVGKVARCDLIQNLITES